jgi:transposase-like protein
MLKFMEQPPLCPELMTCPNPNCAKNGRIGVHSQKERRYICHACHQTFSETKGTPLYDLKCPLWVVILVLTLLAHGCPLQAIVTAFFLDERTVAAWQRKGGQHGEQIQDQVVCNGQVELGQIQADELYVKVQGGKVWMATAMSVFSRLFLWGEVAAQRDRHLIERVIGKVRAAAGQVIQPVLFAIDGLAAYPKAVLKFFYTKQYSGKRGHPRHLPWSDLHIVQVVKHRSGKKLKEIERRLVHGCQARVDELIAQSQTWMGRINTAYVERLNATFRALLPSLARHTRNVARTTERLRAEMFWSGVVYNFCTVHSSLNGTPGMAAGLTDHVWSVRELLFFKPSRKPLHAVL